MTVAVQRRPTTLRARTSASSPAQTSQAGCTHDGTGSANSSGDAPCEAAKSRSCGSAVVRPASKARAERTPYSWCWFGKRTFSTKNSHRPSETRSLTRPGAA
jgi:hypothetical protein